MNIKKFYCVVGRIPGDDEDSCYCSDLPITETQATKAFIKMLYEDADESKKEIKDSWGTEAYINLVLSSDTKINIDSYNY